LGVQEELQLREELRELDAISEKIECSPSTFEGKGCLQVWGLTGKKKGKKLAQNPNMLEFHKREMRVKMVC
jgi:hypothetical protein